MRVSFLVEGKSDKYLINSKLFRRWLEIECNIQIIEPVVVARGNGQMCSRNITTLVERLRIQAEPDKVVVLADLDPNNWAPCISKRKEIIGANGIDLIVIARKAMESWFLADSESMRKWTKNEQFHENLPENSDEMPWDRLKEIGRNIRDGPGSKPTFARKFIKHHGFDITRAAAHPNCPSAKYFVDRLKTLKCS